MNDYAKNRQFIRSKGLYTIGEVCMSISSIRPFTFRISNYTSRVLRKVADKVPCMTVKTRAMNESIKWVGKHISSPQNRLILGISALMSQPFIDLHNKRVDETTRKTSAARTVAKIIAGTTTGFLVRYYAIKAVDKMANIPSKKHPAGSWSTFLSPDRMKVMYRSLDHYKFALGTLLGIGIMLFTNFLIDAPATKLLTNKFISIIDKNEKKKAQKQNIKPVPQYNGDTNLIRQKVKEINSNTQKEAKHD